MLRSTASLRDEVKSSPPPEKQDDKDGDDGVVGSASEAEHISSKAVPATFSIILGLEMRDRISILTAQGRHCKHREKQRIRRKLAIVLVLLAASFVTVNVMSYFIAEQLVGKGWLFRYQRQYDKDPDSDTYRDIVRRTIPAVKRWYDALGTTADPFLPYSQESSRWKINETSYKRNVLSNSTDNLCLQSIEGWFTSLGGVAPFVTPEETHFTLDSMGLLDSPKIVAILEPLLLEGTNTGAYLSASSQCLAQSRFLSSMACDAMMQLQGSFGQVNNTRSILTRAVVVEALTSALMDDLVALQDVIERMHQKQRVVYDEWVGATFSPTLQNFFIDKYDGVVVSLRDYLASRSSNTKRRASSTTTLQINILEAVAVDIKNGFHENARVGVALAAALSPARTAIDNTYHNNQMSWRLGKEWVEAYIAWNLAFVSGLNMAPLFFRVYKLMIPSVACEMSTSHGAGFMSRRLVSLSLFLMGLNDKSLDALGEYDSLAASESMRDFVAYFGERNMQALKLASPSRATVEDMFYDLCDQGRACLGTWKRVSESSPTFELDGQEYNLYSGFVLLLSMMFLGVGVECLVFWGFLRGRQWTAATENKWRQAQYVFSLFAMTSLGLALSRNYVSVLTTVVGLWKFGFPECVSYMYMGLFAKGISVTRRVAEISNGVGTMVHHGAATIVIVMLLSGVLEADRHVSDPIFVLAMQHWFVILRYVWPPAYVIIELVLEVFFEWSIFATFELVYFDHWSGAVGAAAMVFSHWLFLLAGGLEIMINLSPKRMTVRNSESERDMESTEAFTMSSSTSLSFEDDGMMPDFEADFTDQEVSSNKMCEVAPNKWSVVFDDADQAVAFDAFEIQESL